MSRYQTIRTTFSDGPKVKESLASFAQKPRIGVIDGGRILRFSCKPIKGKKLKRILSKFPKVTVLASFDQFEPHPPRTRLFTTGPLAYTGLEEIIENYDSTWEPKPWEWHGRNVLVDGQEYTLLHFEVSEVLLGINKGALRKDEVEQRTDLIKRLERYQLSPVIVPSHKRR